MREIGIAWEIVAVGVLVFGLVAFWLEWRVRPYDVDELDALPWWYCGYCGSIFNHEPTGGPCPTEALVGSGSATPVTGSPYE